MTRDTSHCGTIASLDLSTLITSTSPTEGVTVDTNYSADNVTFMLEPVQTMIAANTTFYVEYVIETEGTCRDTMPINVFIQTPADAGSPRDTTICMGQSVNLDDLQTVTPESYYEETPSGGLSGNTFDSDGLPAGDYVIEHIAMAMDPCPNDSAQFTITVTDAMECVMDFTTTNTIVFSDPCDCLNPLNSSLGLDILLEDTLVAMGDPGQTVAFESDGSSGFRDVNGNPIADGTPLVEGPAGTYKLQFYRLSGEQPVVFIRVNNQEPFEIDQDILGVCFCAPIPTLGEWALIILAFALIIPGVLLMRRRSKLDVGVTS